MNRYCNLANIGAFLNFKLRHVFLFPNMSQRQGTDQYQPSMPDMATAFNVTKSSISAAWDESWDISGDVWRTVPYVPYSWAILGGKCIINSIHTWSILFCNWSEAQNSQCFVDLYTLMNVDSSWCFMLLLWWRKATLTPQNGFGHHHTRITIYGVGGSSFFCLEAEVPAFYHFAMHINGWRVVNRDGRAVLWQWRFTFPWDAGLTWKVWASQFKLIKFFVPWPTENSPHVSLQHMILGQCRLNDPWPEPGMGPGVIYGHICLFYIWPIFDTEVG